MGSSVLPMVATTVLTLLLLFATIGFLIAALKTRTSSDRAGMTALASAAAHGCWLLIIGLMLVDIYSPTVLTSSLFPGLLVIGAAMLLAALMFSAASGHYRLQKEMIDA